MLYMSSWESAAKTITESALSKIGSAGEGERQRFVSLVKDEMKGLQERVKEVRQSAEELTGIKVWDEFLVFLYVKNADLARLLKRAFHVELGHYTLRSGTGKTRISLIPKDNILSKKLLDDQKKMLDLTGYFAVHFGEYYELNIHKVPRNSEFLRETN